MQETYRKRSILSPPSPPPFLRISTPSCWHQILIVIAKGMGIKDEKGRVVLQGRRMCLHECKVAPEGFGACCVARYWYHPELIKI